MKTIFITGTSSGIGKATVKYFQQKGWNVAATMRKPEQEKELNQLTNVKCLRLDVSDVNSIRQAIDATIKAFGGIDVILNNVQVMAR
jgi:NAD(P)-dependent dehydrogenase (short-subunit alcohol dehydrogenase family)